MKTLQTLAFEAIPNPGLMARTLLVPWHLIAKQLEARDYEQMRNKFCEKHHVTFRYVCKEFRFIKAWYSAKNIYPSTVPFLDKYWIRFFGSET